MSDQWFYRMFGHDFGPVSLQELKSLIELDSLSANDEVRPATSDTWATASSVSQLGLGSKPTVAPIPTASPVETSKQAGANDWYYQFLDQEMGPASLDEIVAFAEQGQLTAEDNVKLGANGKWRRVGSIGRLAAVLPYQSLPEPEPSLPVPKPVPVKSTAPTSAAATIAASTPATPTRPTEIIEQKKHTEVASAAALPPIPTTTAEDLALAQAQTAFNATERQAHEMVMWGFAPNVDPAWWGWIGGVEYGPVGFRQVWEWARAGQLKSTDFVRNGMYGQYCPAANVPGLMMAASMLSQASIALSECKSKAEAARLAVASVSRPTTPAIVANPPAIAATPSTTKPVSAVAQTPASSASQPPSQTLAKSSTAETSPSKEAVKIEATEPTRQSTPAPPPMSASSGGFATSSSSFASAAPRPTAASPRRPTPSSSSSSSLTDLLDKAKDPKIVGAIASLALLVLLVFGWQYLPASTGADIKRYQQLKEILDEVRSKRSAKSTDFSAVKTKAEKVGKEIADAMKVEANSAYPAKQLLLWASRDELPRMLKGDLAEESTPEKNFAARLEEAAKMLNVK